LVRTTRQTEIIEESLRLVAEFGMDGLTYRNLSERFGISVPAFYRHFASKTDILLGIIDYFQEKGARSFQEAQAQGTDPVDRVRIGILGHARLFSEQSGLVAVLFPGEIGGASWELHQAVLKTIQGNHEKITALLAEAAAAGLVRTDVPPERLASVLMASLRLAVTLWRLEERQTDLVGEVTALWEHLRRLISAPEDPNREV
jgi:AcrR family transcriptional regulator